HRDIKPDNIMITEAGQLKVLDFGIAQLDTGAGGLTTVGTVIGSPPYMAPERWTGGRVDGRADLYALGCLLVELLTGARPFAGDSTPVLMYQHLNEPPPALDPARYGLPEHLPALVADLLAKDPAERPADARTVERRLADAAQGRAVPPAPTVVTRTAPARRPAVAPVRRRAAVRRPGQPTLRPVGRPALAYPEPPAAWHAGRAVPGDAVPVPVEDRAVLRARLLEHGRAARDASPGEAVRLLGPVVDAALPALGATDPEVVAARRELGAHLARAGRPAQAVLLVQDLLADLEPALGAGDPQTVEVRCDLVRIVRNSGETVTAIRLLTELLPVLELAGGPRDPLLLQARRDLAACQAQRGDFQGAALRLDELLPDLVEAFGPHDRRSMHARADLAEYRKRARFRHGPNQVVRGWRIRLDRAEAERLVRLVRAGGESGAEAARALRRGTGVKGVVDRVAEAPGFVSDADLVEEILGP
ncbi:protein kinase domain-containing protein, partial [Streptomyces rubellomurinus]|uniref:protein kinase domain-containing protein n=1 Tax=Streptomyces rubellomurinus (strain ATCC 31215) TaxID=359131 RepID=UPI000696F3C7